MARYAKFFSLGGGGGPNNLQLPVGTILDATLRQVQDGLGTGSPLYLSTGSVRIGTTAGSAMYWDNTNNRLGVGTNAPSFPVDVAGEIRSTTQVSAGTTGTNGTFLLRRTTDGNTIGSFSTSGNEVLITEFSGSGGRLVTGFGTTALKWLGSSSQPRIGVGFNGSILATTHIQGSGSTSATTSLLVQNSSGQQLMSVTDDGSCTIGISSATTNPLTIVGNTGIQAIIGNTFFQSPQGIYRYGGGVLSFFGGNNDGTGFNFNFLNQQLSSNVNSVMVNLGGTYQNQTSFQFANLRINPVYDFNANTLTTAIARGIYYNPTITNLRVAQHRAIETVTGDVLLATTSGQVGIGTTTPVGILHLYKSAAATRLAIDGDAGQNRLISYRTGAVQRFGLYVNNTAESGANAGSNFAIRAYSDAGTLLSTPFFINRASGNVGIGTTNPFSLLTVGGQSSFYSVQSAGVGADFFYSDINPDITAGANNQVVSLVRLRDRGQANTGGFTGTKRLSLIMENAAGNQFPFQLFSESGALRIGFSSVATPTALVHLQGSGSTSATTPLLIQNSSGTQTFKVQDDGLVQIGRTDFINWTFFSNTLSVNSYAFIGSNNGTIISTGALSGGVHGNNDGGKVADSGISVPQVASAVLEVSSTTRGFLPPRMTTAEKNLIATPATGLMVFDTNLARPCFFNGATWITL